MSIEYLHPSLKYISEFLLSSKYNLKNDKISHLNILSEYVKIKNSLKTLSSFSYGIFISCLGKTEVNHEFENYLICRMCSDIYHINQ